MCLAVALGKTIGIKLCRFGPLTDPWHRLGYLSNSLNFDALSDGAGQQWWRDLPPPVHINAIEREREESRGVKRGRAECREADRDFPDSAA